MNNPTFIKPPPPAGDRPTLGARGSGGKALGAGLCLAAGHDHLAVQSAKERACPRLGGGGFGEQLGQILAPQVEPGVVQDRRLALVS